MGFGTSSQAPADSARLFPLALSKAQVAFRPLRFYGGATMRIAKQDVSVRIDVPGAIARQKTEFGTAAEYGAMRGESFSPGDGHQKALMDVVIGKRGGRG